MHTVSDQRVDRQTALTPLLCLPHVEQQKCEMTLTPLLSSTYALWLQNRLDEIDMAFICCVV